MHPTDAIDSPGPRSRTRRTRALWVASLALLWWWLDTIFASTLLVTPIAPAIWWTGTIAGMAAGAALGHAIARGEMLKPRNARMPGRGAFTALLCTLGLILGAMVGNQATWRVADTLLFWGSTAPITATAFPIRDFQVPRGGAIVSIGSRGQRDALAISKADRRLLEQAQPLHRPWRYCLTLRRQEQGNAVRIWRPSRPRLSSKALTVTRCPKALEWL